MNGPPLCPKCNLAMEEGFINEVGLMATHQVPKWTAGAPLKSFATGVPKVSRRQYRIQTFRCPECGLLQSYAGDQVR